MLTDEQVQRYHDNGCLVVPDLLNPKETTELQTVTDELVNASALVQTNNELYDLEPGHSTNDLRVRRLKSPHLYHEVYNRIVRHKKVLDIVEQLIGPGIRLRSTKMNMKSPSYGSPVEWHQDWAFYPHTNDDILAVGIAIDDMTRENGGLMVVPGSHRGPLYNHHENGFFVGAITDKKINLKDATTLEVPAGGITLHHVRLLHGSLPNYSSFPRRLLLLELCAVDAWPLLITGGSEFSLEEYNAQILRGSKTLMPRIETTPVQIPLPVRDPGSIYQIQSKLTEPVLANLDRI